MAAPPASPRMIFVNLAVEDVARSKTFFTSLGFEINADFSNETCTCVVVNPTAFVMLLDVPFFKTFTKKPLVNAREATELLCCFSAESRAAVDKYVEDAIKLGGKEPREAQDMGFMYSRAFEDLDGHIWEVCWMDPAAIPPAQQGAAATESEPDAKREKPE